MKISYLVAIAVREALKSGRSINRILIADSAHGGSMPEIMTLARERRIIVQNVNTENLIKSVAVNVIKVLQLMQLLLIM